MSIKWLTAFMLRTSKHDAQTPPHEFRSAGGFFGSGYKAAGTSFIDALIAWITVRQEESKLRKESEKSITCSGTSRTATIIDVWLVADNERVSVNAEEALRVAGWIKEGKMGDYGDTGAARFRRESGILVVTFAPGKAGKKELRLGEAEALQLADALASVRQNVSEAGQWNQSEPDRRAKNTPLAAEAFSVRRLGAELPASVGALVARAA
jgi:hypothetical protein